MIYISIAISFNDFAIDIFHSYDILTSKGRGNVILSLGIDRKIKLKETSGFFK